MQDYQPGAPRSLPPTPFVAAAPAPASPVPPLLPAQSVVQHQHTTTNVSMQLSPTFRQQNTVYQRFGDPARSLNRAPKAPGTPGTPLTRGSRSPAPALQGRQRQALDDSAPYESAPYDSALFDDDAIVETDLGNVQDSTAVEVEGRGTPSAQSGLQRLPEPQVPSELSALPPQGLPLPTSELLPEGQVQPAQPSQTSHIQNIKFPQNFRHYHHQRAPRQETDKPTTHQLMRCQRGAQLKKYRAQLKKYRAHMHVPCLRWQHRTHRILVGLTTNHLFLSYQLSELSTT